MNAEAFRAMRKGFMFGLARSGFPNREIARQVGLSVSAVEKSLRGFRARFGLPSWTIVNIDGLSLGNGRYGEEELADRIRLNELKAGIGRLLSALWRVRIRNRPRPSAWDPDYVRPHKALVHRVMEVLGLFGFSPGEVKRWMYPGRQAHIWRRRSVNLKDFCERNRA